jgi:hypothetical protein
MVLSFVATLIDGLMTLVTIISHVKLVTTTTKLTSSHVIVFHPCLLIHNTSTHHLQTLLLVDDARKPNP